LKGRNGEGKVKNVYDVFTERGFVEQVTDEAELRTLLQDEHVTCYIGFDPTATSLHIGSLVPIMALMHMQERGHRPIILIGGGTGLIGDPSGKSEMRQILTREDIDYNASCLQKQLSRYMDFGKGKAILLNNAEWLTGLKYIEFLRDIGRHFSVNKMLAAESYRMRLETGLNFIEFNYMLLQAYDFLYLFTNYGCVLQMGGNDQWGNMLAGSDLIRRMKGQNAFSITFPLITTSHGYKMGKTEKGTVWLDPELSSPYEYYQFWINTDDSDVERFLALFTFLPMDEIKGVTRLDNARLIDARLNMPREMRTWADARLNMAKAVLAFEATKITHGSDAAIAAWTASVTAFNTKPIEDGLFPSSDIPREDAARDMSAIPTSERSRSELEKGIPAFKLACEVGLAGTRGEARRLIAQGGIYINDRPIEKFDEKITVSHLNEHGEIHLRKGKKKHALITVK
jgi:tyrosyl-tRNA synthetase